MQDAPLKTIMVGCGGMSGTWLKAATGNPAVRIVALVDLNTDAARARAQDFSLTDALITDTLETALTRTGADVVFDCTAPVAHHPVTLMALRHGCHVLGEKPMADSMENARAMVAAAAAAGRTYAVIQNQRYAAGIRRLRAFLDTGALGRLTTVNTDFFLAAHFGGFRAEMEHVLLLDMAIHHFDAARFLLGGARARAVSCVEWNPPGSWYRHGAAAAAAFEMEHGVTFQYRGNWCAEGLSTSWHGDWRIVGERGTVLWNGGRDGDDGDYRVEVVESGPGLQWPRRPVPVPTGDFTAKAQAHQSIIDEFVDRVRGGGVPETVCTDNVHSLAMVFAAIDSARRGARVTL